MGRLTIFVSFFALILGNVVYADWLDNWIQAVEQCNSNDYELAEYNFTLAIEQLESNGNIIHPHVYVDRARLYSLLNRDSEALIDLNKAFASNLLQGDDLLRAVVTRITTHYRLGNLEEAQEDIKIFRQIYPIPQIEISKDRVIVRNLQNCECTNNFMKKFIAKAFCDSENDVQMLPNGICIAKRKKCRCRTENKNSEFKNENPRGIDLNLLNKECLKKKDCEYYCNKAAIAGNIFCGAFKKFRCSALCMAVVEALKEGCYWCCAEGNFYKKCIEPLEDIVGAMGNVCDPAWD